MTALDDAARAVGYAANDLRRELENPTEWVTGETGASERDARKLVDNLIVAVRAHDAERILAQELPENLDRRFTGYVHGWGDGQREAADAVRSEDPDPFPEVEVRFAGGPTVRIAGFSVTTEAGSGSVAVEGFLSSWTGHPQSGDAVRIDYLGIPGRGALADITASVATFTRMGVTGIRIRTTIRDEEPTP